VFDSLVASLQVLV